MRNRSVTTSRGRTIAMALDRMGYIAAGAAFAFIGALVFGLL